LSIYQNFRKKPKSGDFPPHGVVRAPVAPKSQSGHQRTTKQQISPPNFPLPGAAFSNFFTGAAYAK